MDSVHTGNHGSIFFHESENYLNSPEATTGGASAYTFDNYQEDAGTTAIYPGAGSGEDNAINYVAIGIANEAGELLGHWKKHLRGDPNITAEETRTLILKEAGDVLWYLANVCSEYDVKLSDVAADNYRKLNSRKQRDKLTGSGDHR